MYVYLYIHTPQTSGTHEVTGIQYNTGQAHEILLTCTLQHNLQPSTHRTFRVTRHTPEMLTAWIWHAGYPRTEDIVIKIITTGKISKKFSLQSPYISNTFSRESLEFQTSFHMSKQSLRHTKELPGKLIDLEIQIFYKFDLLHDAHCNTHCNTH